MKSKKNTTDASIDSGKPCFEIIKEDGPPIDRVVCDFSNERTLFCQRDKSLCYVIEENEAPTTGFFTTKEIDQLNSLNDGTDTGKIIDLIGIHRLRCGVRLYRILNQLYNYKKACRGADFNKRMIAFARRRREICGQRPRPAEKKEAAEKWLQFVNELRREEKLPVQPLKKESIDRLASDMLNEELLREAISMLDSEPEVLRKLQWSKEITLSRKTPDYPLYFLILFLGVHLMEKLPKRKCPPYAIIGRFLMEQDIKTYALEKGAHRAREELKSKDVKKYFINGQEIREGLDMFYEQCRNIYIAPLTLPSFGVPNSKTSAIEASLEADQRLRRFADTPVTDAPSFFQLFPPLEQILPHQMTDSHRS